MSLRVLLAALVLATQLPPALAQDGVKADVANDRFVAGGTVRQEAPVGGDLFGMAGTFDLAARVLGDAVLAGGDVRVRDSVGRDLYAAGGNVRVDGAVAGSAHLAGGNVEVSRESRIGGNLSVAGGSIEIRGPVDGNVDAAGGDVVIDSEIAGDVRFAGGGIELGPNARIGGRLVHRGPDNIRRDPAAQVSGGVERAKARRVHSSRDTGHRAVGWLWTLGLVALAGVVAGAFPVGSRRLGEGLRGEPALALAFGFVALVCVPVAAVILMITIIGIPLALAVLLLYFLMLIVGYAAIAVVIGDTALARLRSQDAARIGWRVGAAMLAMLALAIVGRIPFVGSLIVFAALLAGVGAIVMAIRSRRQEPAAA